MKLIKSKLYYGYKASNQVQNTTNTNIFQMQGEMDVVHRIMHLGSLEQISNQWSYEEINK